MDGNNPREIPPSSFDHLFLFTDHITSTSCSVYVSCHWSASLCLFSCFILPFFCCLEQSPHIMQVVMCAQLVLTEQSRKRVVYRSPPRWLVDLPFPFIFQRAESLNCAGNSEVRLSRFRPRWKTTKNVPCPDWLNGLLSGCVTWYIKPDKKSQFPTTQETAPHLLTPFATKQSLCR